MAWFALRRVIREHPDSPTIGIVTASGYSFMVRKTKQGWSITQTEGATSENQDRN